MMKKTVSVLLALLLVMTLTVAMAETVKYVSTANIAEGTEWWQVLDETTGQVGFMPGKYLVPVPQATVTADANAE